MASSNYTEALGRLQTEGTDSLLATSIDSFDTEQLCGAFLREEAKVAGAIASCLPTIASLVDELVPRIRAGGRLIYVGAGNSGRVAFMDCSELPATFSADPNQFLALVAGGPSALIQAREEAEDSRAAGAANLVALDVHSKDTVIGISASGRTPFVLGALESAIQGKALTAGVTNNQSSDISRLGLNYVITALVGPEFIAGSTRLKAGSAAKQILNMISTCLMIKLGKTHGCLMLDVRIKNNKLRTRGRRIVRQVCGSGPLYLLGEDGALSPQVINAIGTVESDAAIDIHIQRCGGSVKLACAVAMSGFDCDSAKCMLDLVNGNFQEYIKRLSKQAEPAKPLRSEDTDLFIAIDGGGTHCTASIATRSGVIARAAAGACNVNCVRTDDLIQQINTATTRALTILYEEHPRYLRGADRLPRFTKVWAALAGLHHAHNPEAVLCRLEELFSVSEHDGSLRLTSDDMLLSACVGIDDSVEYGISIIAGTGSVATAFRKAPDGEMVQVGRAGGWGYLIGDHGSAFDIGRMAVQAILTRLEQSQDEGGHQLSDLERTVLDRLGCTEQDLLSTIFHHSSREPKLCIADLAKVVTELGFRDPDPDLQALAILRSAARGLVKLIEPLARKRIRDPRVCSLIMSGALLRLLPYRDLVMNEWTREQMPLFRKLVVVDNASECAAKFLAKDCRHSASSRK
ncbi:Glucokinase regulator family protein [Pleurostoma richardsiae]|uniref:Glucokinase regulator family protein n=1 Tax=Pleurostoma richardsiae TaxID=41990 RepID=A0AA38RDI3_9PEZI|nr:Glucokinase regulator family protein [Pleurostoma richardsiae]